MNELGLFSNINAMHVSYYKHHGIIERRMHQYFPEGAADFLSATT